MNESKPTVKDAKKLFRKLGACSSTLFYILNRDFGHQKEIEVRAAAPLAGGILQYGYQCGMLWGAVMAAGGEAFRRFDDQGKAIAVAIKATQHIMESFKNRTGSIDCIEVTETDWHNKLSIAKFMLTGKFLSCFKLIEKWSPEAIQSAYEGLALDQIESPEQPISCASEVAKKMGATDEQMLIVAGFAGGLGLSGNACGALSAAIWMNTLAWCRKQTGKSAYLNPNAKITLEAFYNATDYEILCNKISGQSFKTLDEHTEFIKNGGCEELIEKLAGSYYSIGE